MRLLVGRNLRSLALASGAERVLGVAIVLVLARHLGTAEFGRYTLLLALVALASAGIGELGTSGYLIREATRRPHELGLLLGDIVVVRLVMGGALIGVLSVIGSLSGYDRQLLAALALISVATVFNLLSDAHLVALQSMERLTDVAVARIERALINAAAILAAVLLGGRLVAVAAAILVAAMFFVPFVVRRLRRRWREPVPLRFPQLRRRAWPMLGFSAVWLLTAALTYFDSVMVYWLEGAAEAGLYGAAYRLLLVLQTIPALYTDAVTRPFSALAATDVSALGRLYAQLVKHQVAVGVPIALVGVAFAGSLTTTLFGQSYANGAGAAALLLIVTLVDFPAWIMFTAGFALGLEGWIAKCLGIVVLGNVVANLFVIPKWGATGAAAATLGATAALTIAVGVKLHSRGFSAEWRQWSKPLFAGMPALGVLLASRDLPSTVSAALGLAAYAAVFVALRGVSAEDRLLMRALVARQGR